MAAALPLLPDFDLHPLLARNAACFLRRPGVNNIQRIIGGSSAYRFLLHRSVGVAVQKPATSAGVFKRSADRIAFIVPIITRGTTLTVPLAPDTVGKAVNRSAWLRR